MAGCELLKPLRVDRRRAILFMLNGRTERMHDRVIARNRAERRNPSAWYRAERRKAYLRTSKRENLTELGTSDLLGTALRRRGAC